MLFIEKFKTQTMQDINIKITDRDGVTHDIIAPTDMAMNLMEVVRSYELAPEGTIGVCGGMVMCASCQCYVLSETELPEMSDDDIDLDIEKSLDHLVDTGKDKIADLDETDIDQAGNLDLAQVYIDMEDHEAAKELLDEVSQKGTPEQQKEAADLLKDLDKIQLHLR